MSRFGRRVTAGPIAAFDICWYDVLGWGQNGVFAMVVVIVLVRKTKVLFGILPVGGRRMLFEGSPVVCVVLSVGMLHIGVDVGFMHTHGCHSVLAPMLICVLSPSEW